MALMMARYISQKRSCCNRWSTNFEGPAHLQGLVGSLAGGGRGVRRKQAVRQRLQHRQQVRRRHPLRQPLYTAATTGVRPWQLP